MSQTLIETRNLIKRYGDKIAVNDVSFDVYQGEVFGFLGPNGAGKTSTIRMMDILSRSGALLDSHLI